MLREFAADHTHFPWFALFVRSRHEDGVKKCLAGKGFEVFLPTYRFRAKAAARFRTVELPLFPGYLFCRFNPHQRLPILQTPWVLDVVRGEGKAPAPIDEREVRSLQIAQEAGANRDPCPFIEVGSPVEVCEGPLAGVRGILKEFKGNARLVISVALLQRSVAVEFDRSSVIAAMSASR